MKRFKKILEKSGFYNITVSREGITYRFDFNKDQQYTIYGVVRRIGKSGWSDKHEIRRAQITGFDMSEIKPTTSNSASMIIGIERIFDRDIVVVWNIYNFGSHKKNRSCYVKTVNIYSAFANGYIRTTDTNQTLLLSDETNFDKILKEYIMYNKGLGDYNELTK